MAPITDDLEALPDVYIEDGAVRVEPAPWTRSTPSTAIQIRDDRRGAEGSAVQASGSSSGGGWRSSTGIPASTGSHVATTR